MIGIRVDGNREIATGHFMRCLSIASGIRNRGLECVFITADETGRFFLSSYGFKIICLNSQWDKLDQETDHIIEVIQLYGIDKLIVDTYYVTLDYLKALEDHTKVIYIDDLNLFRYPVSMMINYNIYYKIFSYEKIYQDSDTKLLLGCRYAPLRAEFIGLKPSFRSKVKKVLITTGGTDQFNVAGKLLKKITLDDFFRGIEFHVVMGSLNRNGECLKALAEDYSSIFLHKNVRNMAKLMMSCDSAITAGGSTMYELCACGIPAITFSFADNQLYGVKGFEKEGIMAYAGDVGEDEEKCIKNLISYLKEYIDDPDGRKEKSIEMRKKVDGKGVERIVEIMISR